MWTRRTFRVILYRKSLLSFNFNTLNRLVVQVYMCDFNVFGLFDCFRIYPKAMVLGSDLTFTRNQVFYRVIKSPMTMMHFESRNIVGQREQLVTKADSKYGLIFFHDPFYRINCIIHSGRIARAIGNKVTRRLELFYFFQLCFSRKNFYVSSPVNHAIADMGNKCPRVYPFDRNNIISLQVCFQRALRQFPGVLVFQVATDQSADLYSV